MNALRWDDHCTYLSKKLNSTVFVMCNLKSKVSLPILRQAYFGLFGSYLGYGLIAWGSSDGSARIFSIQRRVVRVMTNLCYGSDCREQFKQLGILTLLAMYIYECLKYIHKRRDIYTKHADVHEHNTRGKDSLRVPAVRLTQSLYSGEAMAVRFYNVLPDDFRAMGGVQFKLEIKKILMAGALYSSQEYFEYVKRF